MFGIENLNNRITELEMQFNKEKEQRETDIRQINIRIDSLLNKVEDMLAKFANENDKRFVNFHREIASQYFDTLEKIFRFNKEISLINTLASQVGEKDLAQLKAALLQPAIEQRHIAKKAEVGVKLMDKRNALHDEILRMERQNQPFEKIAPLKTKLEKIDQVLEEVK